VESFERTLAFVASKERPALFILDYLKPGLRDHGLAATRASPMEVDNATASVTVSRGKACLAVKLLATEPFAINQFSGFPVRPEERAAGFPDQWHLTAHTTSRAAEVKFLRRFVPYRPGEKAPEITALTSPQAAGFRIGDTWIARGGARREGNHTLAGYQRRRKIGDPDEKCRHAETIMGR